MANKNESTKYLSSDLSPTQLEIETTKLLKLGFERRNFGVKHLGEGKTTPRGKPDIILFNDKYHINIEVTKTTKSQADREFNSIKEHLQDSADKNKTKKCYCIYISPETFKRNMDSFSLFNKSNELKIFPMDFITFNHFIKYVIENDEKYFNVKDLIKLFDFEIKTTITDSDILEFINKLIIKNPKIEKEIWELRRQRQQQKNKEIESMMKKIHNMLRRRYAQNPDEAVKEVSKIVFMKMYEESKELTEDHENRFTIKRLDNIKTTYRERDPINYLFKIIQDEMKEKEPNALIFDDDEKVSLDADVVNEILKLINGQNFVQLGMDIKGKIYEMFLGSTMKNTALGQYFTPEELIDFVIKIARLRIKDKVLDPFCGTGRFLTKGMDSLVKRAERNDDYDSKDIRKIKKHQFYGVELSKSVFKIARMNMYIHEDGKSNINHDNVITFRKYKEKFDVILTNPPFGDINPTEDVKDFPKFEKQIIKDFPKLDTIKKTIKKDDKEIEEENLKSKGYKGGSFLLQKSLFFLRGGGKLITVMDDGVLNTDDYKEIRDFIREHYFIKAVFSLPQTTFKHLAKSSPKASILYLIKKKNTQEVQKEPVFFSHAEKVGIDTRGRPCRNDLDYISKKFREFEDLILENKRKHNGFFNKKEFEYEGGILPKNE